MKNQRLGRKRGVIHNIQRLASFLEKYANFILHKNGQGNSREFSFEWGDFEIFESSLVNDICFDFLVKVRLS